MKISFAPKTVILFVGPSGIGKSYSAANIYHAFNEQFRGTEIRASIISSDSIRSRFAHSPTLDHQAPGMMYVSEAAFGMLESELTYRMSWPILDDLIVVDSKGYSEAFRNRILTLAKQNGYQVKLMIFRMKKAELEKLNGEVKASDIPLSISTRAAATGKDPVEEYKAIRSRNLDEFFKVIIPNISRKGFDETISVTNLSDMDDLSFEVTSGHALEKTWVSGPASGIGHKIVYAVIPDFHERVDVVNDVLMPEIEDHFAKNNPDNMLELKYVFLGDYLDKGGNTKAAVDFMYDMVKKGHYVVSANHESFAYKWLKDPELKNAVPKDMVDKFFSSVYFLEQDEVTREKFFEIFEKYTVPFLRIGGGLFQEYICTHAPCSTRHLGRFSTVDRRAQRNLMLDWTKPFNAQMKEFFEEASYSKPTHIFGHVAHSGKTRFKNLIFLDKGISEGNVAQAVLLYPHLSPIFIEKPLENASEPEKHGLSDQVTVPFKEEKPFDIKDYNLSEYDLRNLRRMHVLGIKTLAGTMAPAPAKHGELESLRGGLEYFKERGILQVCLQPKFMGSRGHAYIFHDSYSNFIVSRGGYRVNFPEVVELAKTLTDKFSHLLSLIPTMPGEETVPALIIDSELMPWSIFEQGSFISREFRSYIAAAEYEVNQLHNDPIFKTLKFGSRNVIQKTDELVEGIQVFNRNLDFFAKEGDKPYLQPFDILWQRSGKDQFVSMSNHEKYRILNEGPETRFQAITLDLDDEKFEESCIRATNYFEHYAFDLGMEGIVIKPLVEEPGKIPYMKVRNENYLKLVYGFDYNIPSSPRYQSLYESKNISAKVRTSIRERELGMNLLKPNVSDSAWIEGMVKLRSEIVSEKRLDPRL